VLSVLLFCFALCAAAQSFPTKAIRIITPFSAGSGPDAALRIVAEKLAQNFGQPVLVDNRPGANGALALGAAKQATADGYTLVQVDDTHLALQPLLYRNLSYDAVKDFVPVASLFRTYFFVVVGMQSQWASVGDLLSAARARPGELSYGSWFVGSPGHLGAALLESSSHTTMNHVPFKDMAQLFNAVANGEIAWSFGTAASSGALYRAGKLRYLAVTAPRRLANFRAVPTMAESGAPAQFELQAWVALLAPRGTPAPVLERLRQAISGAIADAGVRARFSDLSFEPYSASVAEIDKQIDSDARRYRDIVTRAKISVE
jgi:tripartite-type tricarboxylate transporter receptor subunit TctC